MQSGLTGATVGNINGTTWTANYGYKKDGNIETRTIDSSPTSYEYDTNNTNATVFMTAIL